MTRLRNLAFSAVSAAIIATAPQSDAQAAPRTEPIPSIAVSIAIQKDQIPVGQKPQLTLTIKNISQSQLCFSTASYLYRVHVAGPDGEPPETEYERHRHGDFRPGDGPELMDGPVVCSEIAPGESNSFRVFDLTDFHDLTKPGKYTVFFEVRNEPQGPGKPSIWLRTNTAEFEVLPQAQ